MPLSTDDEDYDGLLYAKSIWNDWFRDKIKFQCYIGNSHDRKLIKLFAKKNKLNDIDLLYIDGNRRYIGVEADYENFKDFVKPGGLIVFHDVVGIEEVAKFWNELVFQFPNKSKTIYCRNGWGIGILYR